MQTLTFFIAATFCSKYFQDKHATSFLKMDALSKAIPSARR